MYVNTGSSTIIFNYQDQSIECVETNKCTHNTITNYILIIYELRNFDHLLGIVSQTRVCGGNRTHDPHTKSLAHYPLDYQGTQ